MADLLKLSNATMSSIIKGLLDIGLISIVSSSSVKGCGRKQVFYSINENFGLILVVNFARNRADICITNVKEELLASSTMVIDGMNDREVEKVILKANELLFVCDTEAPLKNIIISVSGLVDKDEEDREKNPILHAFEKHFKDIPAFLTNDSNLIAYGELSNGILSNVRNGILVLVDQGLGGSLVINGELFKGDNGFSGEFGCLLCESDGVFECLEDVASLGTLKNKASDIVGHRVEHTSELLELYNNDERIHEMVITSASRLGKVLKSLVNALDIKQVVISGRVYRFGEEYINAVREETKTCFKECLVDYSPLEAKAQAIGGAAIGVDYIIKKTLGK